MARKGRTKAPNLFRNVPKNKIHAPRGSARKSLLKPVLLSVITVSFPAPAVGNKKPTSLSAGGLKICFCDLRRIRHPNRLRCLATLRKQRASKPCGGRKKSGRAGPADAVEAYMSYAR